MVEEQLKPRGIRDERVLAAMAKVPREEFVAENLRDQSYSDSALPIGHDQTISQPFIVAFMTEQLRLQPTDRVLEVGTGSGYQRAVLAELVKDVYSIEIIEPFAKEASARLARLGYSNAHVKTGDGYQGWPEVAPFDAIIVTCAPDKVPPPLTQQLKEDGRMIIPVGYRDDSATLSAGKEKWPTCPNCDLAGAVRSDDWRGSRKRQRMSRRHLPPPQSFGGTSEGMATALECGASSRRFRYFLISASFFRSTRLIHS